MRALTLFLMISFVLLFAAEAQAKPCTTFAVIKSYDAASSSIVLTKKKGNQSRFFPQPEGAPTTSKVPKKCKSSVLKKQDSFAVKSTGGRLSITQVRENFSGKMRNDTDDPSWLPAKLAELMAAKTMVLIELRTPVGKKSPYGVSTIYLPITQAERDEIKRLEAQAEDT